LQVFWFEKEVGAARLSAELRLSTAAQTPALKKRSRSEKEEIASHPFLFSPFPEDAPPQQTATFLPFLKTK
jgi:hypothetical protein